MPYTLNELYKRARNMKNKAITLLWYKRLLARLGSRTNICAPTFFHGPEHIRIGNRVFVNPSCKIEAHPTEMLKLAGRSVVDIRDRACIGHRCAIIGSVSLIIEEDALIADGCYISDNNHSIEAEGLPYSRQPLQSEPTVIGKGAWIGQNVCVLAGSTIGERAVIGAGSVVKGHIPPYTIAVGVPARVVKRYCFETKKWIRSHNGEGAEHESLDRVADSLILSR